LNRGQSVHSSYRRQFDFADLVEVGGPGNCGTAAWTVNADGVRHIHGESLHTSGSRAAPILRPRTAVANFQRRVENRRKFSIVAELTVRWQNVPMPRLLFEIWEDPESASFEMTLVTERADELRRKIAPRSVLRHRFHAKSTFEAYQMNYDWHGWGGWKAETDWVEREFNEDEVATQERFLSVRRGA
jgi:hypothetical protein